MGTITPTSDQSQLLNCTTFQIGDTVQSILDGRVGTIVKPDGLVPTFVPLPVPHMEMRPQVVAPVPMSTPAPPTTSNVNVDWIDGTSSLIALSNLRRA